MAIPYHSQTPEQMRELALKHEDIQKEYCLQRFLKLMRWAAEERGGTSLIVERDNWTSIKGYSDSQIDYALEKLQEAGYVVVSLDKWWQKVFGEKIVISWEADDES